MDETRGTSNAGTIDTLPAPEPGTPVEPASFSCSRRRVLASAGVLGAVAVVTTACGSSSSGVPAASSPAASGAAPSSAAPGSAAPGAGDSPSVSGTTLGPTSDVPVGGGKIYPDAGVVVTQPTAGEFKAFSDVCTHQGCTVSEVTTTIDCACHGSEFSITDGSVVQPPATQALAAKTVTVSGTDLILTG